MGAYPRTEPETTVPEQGPADESSAPAPPKSEPVVIDHVQTHTMRCYWDVAQCRWHCTGE